MPAALFSTCLLALAGIVPALAAPAQDTLLDKGYRQMYNLDFPGAHRSFEEWQRTNPEDPLGPVSDAAAYLFAEFDRLHILQSEFFTDDENFIRRESLSPDPAVKQKFEDTLSKADRLVREARARSPEDTNATFAEILRMGLHADYLALIEKRYLASLTEMKAGRILAEQLVAAHPGFLDAFLAVGVENYMLSLKPAPIRWVLRMSGAQTDKEQGIEKLRLTASGGRFLRPYAKLLLAVAALRDDDRSRARSILGALAQEFPGNRLYTQELRRLQ
ncbi:MAG TPA: hypothetical protein VLT57_14100 [Bryobacteraceae bacterium]|nr:hypothetical protein [Bryobacteraceae bacterium]